MYTSVTKFVLPEKAERHRLFGSVDPIPGHKPKKKELMADLQNDRKDFLFRIDHVGIGQVKHPITVCSMLEPKRQTSIANFTLTTSLHRDSKGINMSRLTELLESYRHKGWTTELDDLKSFVLELAERMNQRGAELVLEFPWFYERSAPATGSSGLNHADASIRIACEAGAITEIETSIRVGVTTLCPCSKEISEYSAHNQRGFVTITAQWDTALAWQRDWKLALLDAAESNASSALHPVLKRPDEKYVTERAYENPRFVEDLVRLVAADLYEQSDVRAFTVECRNEESIHLHDAIAKITFDKSKEEAAW